MSAAEIAASLTKAQRFMDEVDAWRVGRPWIEAVALRFLPEKDPTVSIDAISSRGTGAGCLNLWRGTDLVAQVTVIRDEMNFSVMTTWLEPDCRALLMKEATDAE